MSPDDALRKLATMTLLKPRYRVAEIFRPIEITVVDRDQFETTQTIEAKAVVIRYTTLHVADIGYYVRHGSTTWRRVKMDNTQILDAITPLSDAVHEYLVVTLANKARTVSSPFGVRFKLGK